jgi:ABC-type branched-subunit amino acid transport system substrate-binding protein
VEIGFTSILAEEGVSTRPGVILSVEEINANGDINVTLIEGIIKDDASNYRKCKRSTRRY